MVTPTTGFAAASADAARGREADAQAGKAAGAGGCGDAVELLRSLTPDFLHDPRDQRHQRFGMAALHGLRFLRDHLGVAGVDDGGSAGIERGIDGEDQHREC